MIGSKVRVATWKLETMLLAGVLLCAPVLARAQSEQSPRGLQGTWRVQVTQKNCATGAPLGPSFSSMLAFGRGGTMSGTTLNGAFQPGQRSSDFGVWKYVGNHQYTAASEAFIQFTSVGVMPPAPTFQRGTQRIEQVITVSGDQFSSVATVHFYDVTGAEYQSGCAVAAGQRFK